MTTFLTSPHFRHSDLISCWYSSSNETSWSKSSGENKFFITTTLSCFSGSPNTRSGLQSNNLGQKINIIDEAFYNDLYDNWKLLSIRCTTIFVKFNDLIMFSFKLYLLLSFKRYSSCVIIRIPTIESIKRFHGTTWKAEFAFKIKIWNLKRETRLHKL